MMIVNTVAVDDDNKSLSKQSFVRRLSSPSINFSTAVHPLDDIVRVLYYDIIHVCRVCDISNKRTPCPVIIIFTY